MRDALAVLVLTLSTLPLPAATDGGPATLPPLAPWSGKSRNLVTAKNDPWITPAEKSAFRSTPS